MTSLTFPPAVDGHMSKLYRSYYGNHAQDILDIVTGIHPDAPEVLGALLCAPTVNVFEARFKLVVSLYNNIYLCRGRPQTGKTKGLTHQKVTAVLCKLETAGIVERWRWNRESRLGDEWALISVDDLTATGIFNR